MLEQLRDKIKEYLGGISTMKMMMIVVILSIFLGVTYYVYQYYVQPRLNPDFTPNKELESEGKNGEATAVTTGPAKLYIIMSNGVHIVKGNT